MASRRPKTISALLKPANRNKQSPECGSADCIRKPATEFSTKIDQRQAVNVHTDVIRNEVVELRKRNVDLELIVADLFLKNTALEHTIRELRIRNHTLESNLSELELATKSKRSRIMVMAHSIQRRLSKRPSRDELVAKNIYKNESCFDNSLDLIEKHSIVVTVPRILVECVQALEESAVFMGTEGIYRTPANYAQLQRIRCQIDQNQYRFLREVKDAHTFAGIIKLFLRELKSPLISMEHLDQHTMNIMDLPRPDQVNRVVNLVETLPPLHRETVKYFMKHLNKVYLTESNHMDAYALSIVIGACVFYEMMADLNLDDSILKCTVPNFIIELMITHFHDIFE